MDKNLKIFYKVKDSEEEKWDKLIEKILEAEKKEDKKEGSEAFINILKKFPLFGNKKMRKFTIARFREYTEKK